MVPLHHQAGVGVVGPGDTETVQLTAAVVVEVSGGDEAVVDDGVGDGSVDEGGEDPGDLGIGGVVGASDVVGVVAVDWHDAVSLAVL